jgi:hypothetical protein
MTENTEPVTVVVADDEPVTVVVADDQSAVREGLVEGQARSRRGEF